MKALILESRVLAVGEATVTEAAVLVGDVVYPLSVVDGYELIDAAPGAAGGWGYSGGQFVPPVVDLAPLKLGKNAEITAARLVANRGSFDHSGKTFACDELSRSDIDGVNGFVSLTQSLPPGWPGGWKAVDNTYLAIANVAAWIAFYGAMVATGNAHFAKAQTLKTQLAAATTPEEIGAIQW